MPLDGTPGPKTLSVRAFDGEEYSPEVSRTFLVVGEASYAPSGSQGRGGAWALLLIPLLLVAAYVVYKKKIISSL